MIQIFHHHLQQIVHIATERVTGHHLVPALDGGAEALHVAGIVLFQLHPHEGLQAEPEPLGVQLHPVAGNHPAALQPLHPSQAGRGRQVHALGQLGIGEPAALLQLGQQLQVRAVHLDSLH